jgi:polysaccharide deacetylase 2 family uncharacterized protein YibQ
LTRHGRRFSPATVFFALLSLLLALALYLKSCPPAPAPPPPPRPTKRPPAVPRPRTPFPIPRTPHAVERTKAPPGMPRVAIVIDDLGNEIAPAGRIAGWSEPVAGAVLPNLRWSSESALALARGGHEVLLHLPMEPEGYPRVRPGPGVILRSQSDEQIAQTLESDLASVPGAQGVNNHMGSAATTDPRVMRAVARVLSARGLFFLDSRTTDATVAERTAAEASVRTIARRVFLDDAATEEAVRGKLQELVRRARLEQVAVAIGHPYSVTLDVLERELPGLAEQGIRLVRVSELAR